jgi:membrane protease YdiL (CAAX protease family)
MAGIVAALAGAEPLAIEFSSTLAMALIVLAWCAGSRREAVLAMLRWPSPTFLAAGAALSPLTMAIGLVCVDGLHHAFGVPVVRYSPPFLEAGYGWPVVLLMIAVFPAVFEELAFRGVVLQAIQPLLSPGEAVLVSSLMFMILHLSVASFPHTFVLGMAAGWLCLRSRSLLPGMLLHFLHNSYCVAMEWAGIGA